MNRTLIIVSALLCSSFVFAQDAASVAQDVASKIAKVSSFSATLETGEDAEEGGLQKTTAQLLVSREHGWKMTNEGPEPFTIVTDFNTFYQYFPKEKRAMKMTADTPDLKAMFRKPVSEMNPLSLLDRQSIRVQGQEDLDGETVYHIEGTTTSQLMPGGPKVQRTLSAWISVEDGLPRKTVESVGVTTGTTLYKNVKINPPVTAEDFTFTPPPNTAVIDTNEQVRKMEENVRNSNQPPSRPTQTTP